MIGQSSQVIKLKRYHRIPQLIRECTYSSVKLLYQTSLIGSQSNHPCVPCPLAYESVRFHQSSSSPGPLPVPCPLAHLKVRTRLPSRHRLSGSLSASRPYISPHSTARPEIHLTSRTRAFLSFDRVVYLAYLFWPPRKPIIVLHSRFEPFFSSHYRFHPYLREWVAIRRVAPGNCRETQELNTVHTRSIRPLLWPGRSPRL